MAGRLDRTVARKLDMSSPDFHEENMCLTEGTPSECWTAFWNFIVATSKFFGDKNFYKPLRRDVVRKTCWAEIMKEEKSAWAH